MAYNCNTPTFVQQTGLSRTLVPESGELASFAQDSPQYQIMLDSSGCCGQEDGTVVSTGFIYDGTFFHDGIKVYQ